MQTDDEIRAEHAKSGNLFISEGLAGDKMCERLGYKFLGVTKDAFNSEVHIFEIKPAPIEVTSQMILELSRITNAPLDTCNRYLRSTNGDIVEAAELLRKFY